MNMNMNTQKKKIEQYGLSAYVMTITPELAKQILEKRGNPKNRNLSTSSYSNYGRIMRDGKWLLNGEPIVFQSDGLLANGHNRLNALIGSGATVDFLVIEGVSPDAFATFDCGQKRTAAHVLQMEDIPNSCNIASIVSSLIIYRGAIKRDGSYNTYARPTNQECMDEYNSSPDIYQKAYRIASKCKSIVSPTYLGLIYACALKNGRNEDDINTFSEGLEKGQMLSDGNPILVLRETLIRAKAEKTSGRAVRSSNWYKNAITIGWNAYIEGRSIKLIKLIDVNKAIIIK